MKIRYKILIILLMFLFIYVIINAISICLFSTKDEKRTADVAIVLGAGTHNGKVSPVYQERLNHAVTLYTEDFVSKIIVTGGIGKGNSESDAYAAMRYIVDCGIPENNVLLEETSTITQENLENSKNIMTDNGFETAIIVSDPLHMKRSMLLAKDVGITGFSSPTPTTRYVSLKTQLPFLARELFFYIGYKWYRIFTL